MRLICGEYVAGFSGEGYSRHSSLLIDRVTGALPANSVVHADATTGAKWKLMMINASFECKSAPRQF